MYQQYIRQQTTTNDYCRQQTFNQRLSLDKGCYFASSNQSRGDTTKQPYSLITKHTHIMSTMRNSVMLIGRPGAEPETRTFNGNRVVARFNLAVNETRRNAKREQVKDTQWFTVVAWDKTAERVAQTVKKGRQIVIDGALRNNEWTDKNGQRHLSTEIHLNNFILLDWGKEQGN